MSYLYPLLVIINIVGIILTYPLALILPLFATQQNGFINNASSQGLGPRLPSWLNWFQTWDNSLYGDSGFQSINGTSYLSMVKWLIRNPLPCFAQKVITNTIYTISGNNSITDGASGVAGTVIVKSNGLFQFVLIYQLFNSSYCIYLNFGWNLRALTMGAQTPYHATFSFSPRISSF
jgi:hypothetical protein